MKNSQIIIAACLSMLIFSCGENKEKTQAPPAAEVVVNTPKFEADSAYAFIAKQVAFGPRVPNTAPHRATGEWLVGKLESYGATVIEQKFAADAYTGETLQLTNIIGSFFPQAKKRIILAAHWDTRHIADKEEDPTKKKQPIDGANDGASGVAVILEIVRLMAADPNRPDIGIDVIFFDGEDYGAPEDEIVTGDAGEIWWCLGSQYWSKNLHQAGYSAYYGILLDMVGGKDARFYQDEISVYFARNIVNKVWKNAASLGYGYTFPMERSAEIIDDHVFVNRDAGIPMIDIIDFSLQDGFPDHHHKLSDNLEAIDKTVLRQVGETVLRTLYQE